MSIPLDIREVLVCDDVRREDNGKAILIGVYHGEILLPSFPVNIRLCFWMQGRTRKGVGSGEAKFKIEVTDQLAEQSAPVLVDAKFDAPPGDTIGGVVLLAGVPITASQPGNLVVAVNEDNGAWVELMRKRIGLMSSGEATRT